MNVKPSAVIDKCLLQEICDVLPAEKSDALIRILRRQYHLVVTPILIEETIVSFFRLDKPNKPLFQRMLKAIQEMQPMLMGTPLELIFREFILREDISSNWQPDNDMAGRYWETINDPDSISVESDQEFGFEAGLKAAEADLFRQ